MSEDEPLLLVTSGPFEGRFDPQTELTGQSPSQNPRIRGAHHAEKGCTCPLEEPEPVINPLLFFPFETIQLEVGLQREDAEREQVQGWGCTFICSRYRNILGKASLLQEGSDGARPGPVPPQPAPRGGTDIQCPGGRGTIQGGGGGNSQRNGSRGSTG